LEGEDVVGGGLSGQEALRWSSLFEALHLPFASSHHLVRVLGTPATRVAAAHRM
jgi:hypothetical protein